MFLLKTSQAVGVLVRNVLKPFQYIHGFRWLQDLILSAYDLSQQQKLDDDSLWKVVMLESLMNFCMEMEDLPKAFLLSVICIDAVSSASVHLEQKTYGKITQLECVRPWEDLLRKLRVCLLVMLRLGGDVNPIGGINPMTVASVSRPDIFSVYSVSREFSLLLI